MVLEYGDGHHGGHDGCQAKFRREGAGGLSLGASLGANWGFGGLWGCRGWSGRDVGS